MPYKNKADEQARYERYYKKKRRQIIKRNRAYVLRHLKETAKRLKEWNKENRPRLNKYRREYRKRRSKKVRIRERKWRREYNRKHPEKRRKTNRRRRNKNRLQYRAHMKVSYAVQKGHLKRPSRCSRCRKRRKVQGHHRDYRKPLEVVWLCDPCHKIVERLETTR